MNDLRVITDARVGPVFDRYPERVRKKLWGLRLLIIRTAREMDGLGVLEETLKWGEPSYLTKMGSTMRIDWKKKKNPDQYAIYFKCTSKLVPAFKTVYPDIFQFEGNRAIVFSLTNEIPLDPLKKCIRAALTYHKIKDLPLLGLANENPPPDS